MKKLLILLFCFQSWSSWITSQENLIDSTQITKIVRLINDFKACQEYSTQLEDRLIYSREIVDRMKIERTADEGIIKDLDSSLKFSNDRNKKLEKKLKRTRIIGVVGSGLTILSGILGLVLI